MRGLEGTLLALHGAGVRLTIDELRRRVPVLRGGVEYDLDTLGVERPGAQRRFRGQTGGSRSSGVPVAVDLTRPAGHAAHNVALHRAFGLSRPRTAIWFPAPPSVAGLAAVLSHAKVGVRVERWFSQTQWHRAAPRDVALTAATLGAARLAGRALPRPEHTAPDQAARVARWLAGARTASGGACLVGTASGAIRVCSAARELDLDISGTVLRAHGEPLTPQRLAEVESVGARAASGYFVAEAGGLVGLACAGPVASDDVHVALDRVALVQTRPPDEDGSAPLALTTIDPGSSSVLINLELGDEGILGSRDCGCAFGDLGLTAHVHAVRSPEKLTSEGMSFAGSEVVELLETVLPARFGGSAIDYQLVEREEDGLRRVSVVVSPHVGPVDEREVLELVRARLRSPGRGHGLMTEVWQASHTLRVERREPYETPGAKTPLVHVIR